MLNRITNVCNSKLKRSMSQSIVELKNVNIYQSNSLILGDVNISVDKGEFRLELIRGLAGRAGEWCEGVGGSR